MIVSSCCGAPDVSINNDASSADVGICSECYEHCEYKEEASLSYGPSPDGSKMCKSGSVASGGTKRFCTCDICF